MAERIDSLIFDLDGTLWDAVDEIARSWSAVVQAAGLESKAIDRGRLTPLMGMLLPDIAAALFPELNAPERECLMESCCRMENRYLYEHGGKLYPGVRETLEALAGRVKLCIVSNCQDGYIQAFLHAHGLEELFTDYESAGRTGRDKAGNIRAVMERSALRSPAYVGDTAGDGEAARQAGIPFIFAAYGFGRAEGDWHIDSFPQLLPLLDELNPPAE